MITDEILNMRNGLTSITIENFKGIGAPVTVPLRPVTLLFGANSAGKSTIIQALQYAWEVLENRNPDVGRTRNGGEVIDLGGFKNLVHQHDLERKISIKMEYQGLYHAKTSSQTIESYFSSGDYIVDAANFLDVFHFYVKVTTAWDSQLGKVSVENYEVGYNGETFANIILIPNGKPYLSVNVKHPFFSKTDPIIEDDDDFRLGREAMDDIYKRFTDLSHSQVDFERVIPQWDIPVYIKECNYTVECLLTRLLLASGETILNELRNLRYVGPWRQIPDRKYVAPQNPDNFRWANGFGAWDCLFVEKDNVLLEKSNHYISELLDIGYRILKHEHVELDIAGESMTAIRNLLTKGTVDRNDIADIVDKIEKLKRIKTLHLHDLRNDIDVNPMDIGVGVSQTLPVVVGAVEPNCSIFAVEQPELHIHPAVQVNLADIFLRETLEPDVKPRIFLLETHSEHLVLRIMRRMRETCEGTLPKTFPEVKPEDVAVLYVEVIDGHSVVREMPLNERGELIKAWPGGFFEEGLRETL